MTGLTIGLHPGYVSGRYYAASPTDAGLLPQTQWPQGTLFASCFTVSALISVLTLQLMLTGQVPPNNAYAGPGMPIFPGAQISLYANSAGGRPSGTPLGSTGFLPLARMAAPLGTPIALTAGLYWAVTKFYQQGQSVLPAMMALGGDTGGAALLGMASIGTDARVIAGLQLAGQTQDPSIAAITLTGSEAWGDCPTGYGPPLVLMGL